MGEQFDYLDAIEEALTPDAWAKVGAYAQKRCEMLARVGVTADAEELTMDAISDTTLRECPWQNDRYSLVVHLCGVIKGRTSRMRERAYRVRHVPIGAATAGGAHDPIEVEVSEARPPEGPLEAVERADLARQALSTVFAMAERANDRQVMGILRAYAEGITERHELAVHLGISRRKVDYARERLMRLLDHLPNELRAEWKRGQR